VDSEFDVLGRTMEDEMNELLTKTCVQRERYHQHYVLFTISFDRNVVFRVPCFSRYVKEVMTVDSICSAEQWRPK
jgi:hypothetical protein